jgi:hypothetical protein
MAPFCGTEHFRLRYLTLHVARVKEPGLAFRNWFHKPKPAQEHVPGPRILVCSLDPRFSETVIADHKVYGRFFPDSTAAVLDNIPELLDFVGRGYDILHLLCDVSAAGFIRDLRDQTISGTELIDACLAANVKLLWFASDNPSDGYRNFDLKYARLNVVMTLERKGEKFPRFLDALLSEMNSGKSMPVAWVTLAPQIPRIQHDAPETIFMAGRGQVRFSST